MEPRSHTIRPAHLFFLPEPLPRDTGIKGSKYLMNKNVETSQQTPIQHQSSPNATKNEKDCPYWTGLSAVMSKIHQESRSGRPLRGMKVSQQREDGIYFIAWLKSICCVRCWRWRDGMSHPLFPSHRRASAVWRWTPAATALRLYDTWHVALRCKKKKKFKKVIRRAPSCKTDRCD